MLAIAKALRAAIPLLCFLLVGVIGACTRGGPETVTVRGTVEFDGRPQPSVCSVFFAPLEVAGDAPRRPALAKLSPEGTFSVTSFKPGDGLVPGTYRVKIEYYDLKPGGNPDSESGWARQEFQPGELTVESGQAAIEAAYVVPAK
jgi:hypothetical protein